MKKTIIVFALLLSLCLVSALAEGAYFLGQPFPDFTVTDTEGNVFTLSEALKDHEAVLINIWATWCPPCKSEMPFLNEAYEQYGDRVAFIALSCEANDTLEKIEAYRQANGVAFPMSRDEGAALYHYTSGDGIPETVIVDRFGNAVFEQCGAFFSAGEVTRTLEAFLGDDYTETAVLTEIPKDASTCAFPVFASRGIYVENENARSVLFRVEGDPEPTRAFVIEDDTASLRIEVTAEDDPANAFFYDYLMGEFYELSGLIDPRGGAYVYEAPMPGAEDDLWFSCAYLFSSNDVLLDGIFLIPGDEYIEALAEELRASGYSVAWEYAEAAPAEEAALSAYYLYVIDQYGDPVPELSVIFCTDTACTMRQSDEAGTISFDGAPGVYHVEIVDAPEGYSYDENFELYTDAVYGEWMLRIRKD